MENFFKKKNWRGGGIVRMRKRRNGWEGELKPRKWKKEKKSEREGELFKKKMGEGEEEWERRRGRMRENE
jgi:hypothetical protein